MNCNVYINLNYQCNNNCIFCAVAHQRSYSLSFEDVVNFINGFSSSSLACLTLSGGEASIRPDFLDLVKYLSTKDLKLVLQTNARRFADYSFAKATVDLGLRNFYVSLHSHIPNLHEFLTYRKGSFSETINGIFNLLGLGSCLDINCIVVKHNASIIPNYVSWILDEFPNIHGIYITYPVPVGNAFDNSSEILCDFSELRPVFRDIVSLFAATAIRFGFVDVPCCVVDVDKMEAALKQPQQPYDFIYSPEDVNTPPEVVKLRAWITSQTNRCFSSRYCYGCSKFIEHSCPGIFSRYLELYGDNFCEPFLLNNHQGECK
jgi:hypothetical protein